MALKRRGHPVRRGVWRCVVLAAALGVWGVPRPVAAQNILSQPSRTLRLEVGGSQLVQLGYAYSQIHLTNEAVARLDFISPTDIVVNGTGIGVSSLMIWNQQNVPDLWRIEVTPNISALQAQLNLLFPNAGITATAAGSTVILSGTVTNPTIAARAVQLAELTGANVFNNIQAPTGEQILLHVQFAEIRRTALARLSADLFAQNIGSIENVVGDGSEADIQTLAEGIVRLFLIGQDARLEAVINALKREGEFRSLAEPNLVTLDGQAATFLAGGEFPYPTIQAGGGNAVTIQFKQFGVVLEFTPVITNSGRIRLAVTPEVSALDFANGLTIGGFQIPSLLTRRASTNVELAPGQHLAIAGLLNQNLTDAVDKIPLLGDLPIIGTFFRSTANQEERTELLVLVTPYIVEPSDIRPQLPGGDPLLWDWSRFLEPDTAAAGRVMPQRRRTPGGGD